MDFSLILNQNMKDICYQIVTVALPLGPLSLLLDIEDVEMPQLDDTPMEDYSVEMQVITVINSFINNEVYK